MSSLRASKNLWTDTKRVLLNIPWIDEYFLCDEKLIIESGVLRKQRSVIMLYRVVDVELSQGIFQRFVSTGDIILHTNDKTNPVVILQGIKDPVEVMDLIIDLVEAARDKKGIRISEFQRSPVENQIY